MMNVLALSLVVTSLAAASMFSPSPTTENQKQAPASTIVKEGHRVVVVEYDQDGYHNTKISISPEQQQQIDDVDSTSVLENAKDKIKEAASVLPNMGQGISNNENAAFNFHAPKELICDAYGKCKHKIAGAMGKAQDTVEVAREVGNTVGDTVGKAKETVYEKANDVREYTKDSVDKGKEHVVRNVSEVRNSVKEGVKRVVRKLGWSLESFMGVVSLLGFATAYGMCVWITFVSSYVLSRVMPRQQFAVVQSKIYPVYFRAMGHGVGVALLGHVLGHRKRVLFLNRAEMLQAYNLLASLLMVLANSVYLEPRATKVNNPPIVFKFDYLICISNPAYDS